MNLWKWLFLFRRIPIQDLLDFPDITDSDACRDWMLALVDSAQVITELTDMKFDDAILATIESVLKDDTAWNAIHRLLVSVVTSDELDMDSCYPVVGATKVAAAVKPYKFNPAVIMLIIQAIKLLWELCKNRKTTE